MREIKLYTTSGCHLCEQAEEMFLYCLKENIDFKNDLSLSQVEISLDEALMDHYGVRIPVLGFNEKELAWPFALNELQCWLNELD